MSLIVSWNINSARSHLALLIKFLEEYKPEVLLLQEIKCLEENFPKLELEDLGYNIAIHGQKTYNGVAILSKGKLEDVQKNLPNDSDDQSRYIEAVTYINNKSLRVASVYVPNGQEVGSDKFQYKLQFFDKLTKHLKQVAQWEELLLVGGDYNVAPNNIDVYSPADLEGSVCFHPTERKLFKELLNECNLHDAYRVQHPQKAEFSWWDYRAGSWQQNHGLRIDQFLASPEAMDKLTASGIYKEVRGWEKTSDHAPIFCRLGLS